MAIKTNKYKAIDPESGQTIRAVRVTETNYLELAGWAEKAPNVRSSTASDRMSPSGDISDHKITLHVEGLGIRVVRPGDFLFRSIGDAGRVTPEVFPAKEDFFEHTFTLDK